MESLKKERGKYENILKFSSTLRINMIINERWGHRQYSSLEEIIVVYKDKLKITLNCYKTNVNFDVTEIVEIT